MSSEEFEEYWEGILPTANMFVAELNHHYPVIVDRGDAAAAAAAADRRRETAAYLLRLVRMDGKTTYASPVSPPARALESESHIEILELWEASLRDTFVDRDVSVTDVDYTMPIFRLDAPEWYRDEGFLEWLNSPRVSTWHLKGTDPEEYSDAFFTFCQGDGSDSPSDAGGVRVGIPKHIWDQLSFLIARRYGWDAEVLVWVSKLPT